MFTMRDFEERKTVIQENEFSEIYDFEGHRIALSMCDRSGYYFIIVDGKTIATRALRGNGIRKAIAYLNKK